MKGAYTYLAFLLVVSLMAVPVHAREGGDPYIDRVVDFSPGNPASVCCNDPNSALGQPNFNEAALTGWLTLGVGGSVTLEFVDNLALDGPGDDLQIFGDPANDERWKVEVSLDGQSFQSFGLVNEQATLDLGPIGLSSARFVRLTDDGSPGKGVSPGAELDAIMALNSARPGATGQPPAEGTEPALSPTEPPAPGNSPLAARSWVRLGGPLGGLGYDIRMRLDNPDIMYVSDAWSGVNRSADGGLTWEPTNQGILGRRGDSGDGIPVFCLTIDPNDPQIIWAGLQDLGKLYRSTDGGLTWEERSQGFQEAQGLSFRGISIEPGNSAVVYAAAEISSWTWAGKEVRGIPFDLTKGVVYKSTDAGQHWQAIWRGDNLARYVWIDPTNVNTLFISTGIFDREAANSDPQSWRQTGVHVPGGVGIFKSTDGGQTWVQVNQGLKNLYIGSLFMHPHNPSILLAGAGNNSYRQGGGVYLTTDGGEHWQLVQDSQGEAITSVEFSLSNPQIAYAGGRAVFYRSEDGGQTWKLVARKNGRWGPLGIDAGFPIDFQVDPRAPLRILANNYGGGNFLSEDGGETWISASTGYTGADIRDISIHPDNPAIVYATGRSGPFVSYDGGAHWQGINPENLDSMLEGSVIELDPLNPQFVLMTESNITRIYWSTDGGNAWDEANYSRAQTQDEIGPELGLGGLEAVAFSPSMPGRVYGGFGHNACKGSGESCKSKVQFSLIISQDGGRTWHRQANVPLDGLPVTSVVAHPTDPDVAWMTMPAGGVFRTQDGGVTWQPASQGLSPEGVMTLAFEPHNTEVMYAGTVSNGIYKSQDGGETWKPSSTGMDPNEPIFAIAIDPLRPNVVFAGSIRSGVFISQDSGKTWLKLNDGLRTRAVHVLAISFDGETLYAGTRGEGIFRLSTLDQEAFNALTPKSTSIPTGNPPPTAAPALTTSSPVSAAPTSPPATGAEPSGSPSLPCRNALTLPLAMAFLGYALQRRRKKVA